MAPEELEAGSTALVLGSRLERRTFCLDHLAAAERAAAVVLPADPTGIAEEYERLGGEAPLTLVLDEAAGEVIDDGSGVHTVTVDAGSLPSVGEAALATLEGDETVPAADRLWIGGLSDLLDGASVQQVYRLLYILSKRVRLVDGVGLYEFGETGDHKTVSILGQPLDYEVSLAPESGPETRSLAEHSTGA